MDKFHAIAEPTRRNIIEMLASKGELSASDIYVKFKISPPAVSQHLKILREANLVHMEKRAQQHIYKINIEPMIEMEEWINKMTKLWNQRFDELDKLLQHEKKLLKISK